jgi:PilZ domain-containing protein
MIMSQQPAPPSVDCEPSAFFEVDVSPTSESHFFVDLSGDLGHVGIFIATWRELRVGRLVAIGACLSDGRIVVSGRVRWVRDAGCETGPGIGVALDGLSEGDIARIARFCAERPPYYYEVEAA